MELLYKDLQGQLLTVDTGAEKAVYPREGPRRPTSQSTASDSNMPSGYFELYRELIVADVGECGGDGYRGMSRHGAFTYMAGEIASE